MDDASMNQYEKQLYTVFKTFDVNNEEALDRSAVQELCDALQLEDRGAALVNTLFERRSDRVTFAQFRNGLLAVLGGASGEHPPAVPTPPDPPPHSDALPPASDDDSSGREVAPKFVFGSKRYGRRSRPSRQGTATDDSPSPRSSSASRLDTDDKKAKQRMRCRRSASAMETREETCNVKDGQEDSTHGETFEHDRRIDREEALELCRDLNMDRIDRRLIERIFEDSGVTKMSVGEFFDVLNASLTSTMEEAVRSAAAGGEHTLDSDTEGGALPAELVLGAWARAGVPQPRRLLADLGYTGAALDPLHLERALDDELRALAEPAAEPRDAPALLLLAALALTRLRLELTRRRAHHATAERDKLRADLAEANRHARVLAQEVDESHARIEAELKASLRRAELRHTESIREVTTEHQAERERAASTRQKLEAEVARRSEAEARLRGSASALRAELGDVQARAAAAEQRAADAERERARLAGELAALAAGAAAARAAAPDAGAAARLEQLRRDNAALRDRVDELLALLEARAPPASHAALAASSGDLGTELHSIFTSEQDSESSPASMETAASSASVSTGTQTDPDTHTHEINKLNELVKELEMSLEAMRVEYDKCEEYWSGKLSEERAEAAREQAQADERLAALLAKVSEYERQFQPKLPPIDERAALEAQVNDLQEEFTRYRRLKEGEAAAAAQHAARLAARLAAAERRVGAGVGREAREVSELRGRVWRAEGAARRLHARLAAADLLVKDLYLENCHLAHRNNL